MIILNDGRNKLYQWDTNRELSAEGYTQLHFSNITTEDSIPVDVIDGVAKIPDELLQVATALNVWGYIGNVEDGYTKTSVVFPVIEKSKPLDYVFTPTEQLTIQDILDKLDTLKGDDGEDGIGIVKTEINAKGELVITYSNNQVVNLGIVVGADGKDGEKGADGEMTFEDLTPEQKASLKGDAGADGKTPYIKEGYWWIGEANTGVKAQGENGSNGINGQTPYIKDGNWWVGETDTGVKAQGEDGKNGTDGANGKDGYTPVKGVDYFDGTNGTDGIDGTSVTITSVTESTQDDGVNIITFSDGKSITIKNGSKGANGKDGINGQNGTDGVDGKDGVSATHSWNGTILTITSASGTSSADLKGEKGEQGVQGKQGIQGDKGDTGANGKDGVDGKDGTNGKDGTSVTITNITESAADGGNNVVTFSDGKSITIKNGSKGADGKDGQNGVNGKDGTNGTNGISATHSWNGTVLSITSASGTTSANLKGDKGDKGDTGAKGENYILTDADKTEIAKMVAPSVESIPDYVAAEAESVVDRVLSAQGNRTFTFAAIADLHYGNEKYTDGVKHACQAIKYIDSRVKLDAVAILGDYTDGYPTTSLTDAMSDYKNINALLDDLRFAPNLRQQGNHDYYLDNIPITRRFIQSYSDNVVWGDRLGGYFHKDFEDYKLRIICPNTNENNTYDTSTNKPSSSLSMTATQIQWFIQTLDLSNKADAEEWGILILSHHPLDYWSSDSNYRMGYIVNAYKTGGSWSDSEVSCNFAGKNQATLLGNIHGHIHNLLTTYMFMGSPNNNAQTKVYRTCVPNACYGRENQYTGVWGESATYTKTLNSANDTSFMVYVVDLENFTIQGFCYGAGEDRSIEKEVEIVNLLDTVGYTDNMRFSGSNGAEKTENGCVATGYIDVSVLKSNDDHIYAWGANFNNAQNSGKCIIVSYDANKNVLGQGQMNEGSKIASMIINFDAENRLVISRNGTPSCKYIRFSGVGTGENVVVTLNQLA